MLNLMSATPAHHTVILQIQQKAASRTYCPMDTAAVSEFIEHHRAFLILRDKDVIGTIMYKDEGDHFLLEEFVIDSDYRGEGIGAQVLAYIFTINEDGRPWQLYTHPENPAAHLYERNGFKTIEIIPDFYGDGEPRMRMRRRA
jgi:ribosomal protein S18 acetylase RimI-like enzyme